VLSREQIMQSGKVSLGEFLQTLPEQGNAVTTQTNNGNDGSVRVNLRSLGENRTLVLVNGRRMVAGGIGADPAPDLNSIPAAAVERIEVLKDGASAIYGSDAIAGVVNVILRRRYNNTEVSAYAGTSGHNDGQVYDISAVTGTSGDRSGVLFSVGYQEQRPVFSRSRSWAETTYFFDFGGTNTKQPTGNSSTWPQGRFSFAPSNAAATTLCAGTGLTPALQDLCNQFAAGNGRAYMPNGTGGYVPYDGLLFNTNPTNYLITPNHRAQVFSTGDVQFGEVARGFFEASYVNRTSAQSLAPMPVVNTTIPTNPVSISKDSYYNPFGIDITSWRRRTVEFSDRFWKQDLDTFRVVAGLDGSLGDWAGPLKGWAWEASYNHGRTYGTQLQTGEISMSRLANAVGPSMLDPATNTPVCVRVAGDITTKIGGCVPMDVLHGVGTLSAAAKSYVSYDGTDRGSDTQQVWSANVSGDLFRLMADRPAGLALGFDYRYESATFLPNPVTASLDSSGNNQLPTAGHYDVKEAYGELLLPVIGGMPGIEDLELQLAARYTNYSTFGTKSTYKVGARYSPVRDLTIRGTVSSAYRAPNVLELYGGARDDYPLVTDPCNAPSDPVVQARCVAAGVPGGNSGDPSTQLLSKHVASPDLKAETANIFTMGLVLQPRWVPNLTATLDYYNLKIKNTITNRGAALILQQCYTAAVQDPAMCALVIRNTDGAVIQINDPLLNTGTWETSGIDFAARYGLPTPSFGRFTVVLDGSVLQSFKITDSTGFVTNAKGNYDLASINVINGALPVFKMNAGLLWSMGGFGAGVTARYVGSFKECYDSNTGGTLCSAPHDFERTVSSYLPVDLYAAYALKSTAGTTSLMVGVQNVADTQPPFISSAFSANSDPATYSYIGRFFYTRLTHTY
jgi:outer membrane receptor protein involved in Fe transport